jgi:hypothetical protein
VVTNNSVPEAENADTGKPPGVQTFFIYRPRIRFGCGIFVIFLGLASAQITEPHAMISGGLRPQNPTAEILTRPCQGIANSLKPLKATNKKRPQKPGEEDTNTASVCLEMRSKALEVQEYLQSYGRAQKWNLIDEHVADDAWTFSRKLRRDELSLYTNKDTSIERVIWSSFYSSQDRRTRKWFCSRAGFCTVSRQRTKHRSVCAAKGHLAAQIELGT